MPRSDFTVVIPTRNVDPTIVTTLQSITAQTYAPAEVIIVDDDSTDEALHVIESVEGPIRVLRGPSTGPSGARNAGVEAARTEWVAFVDADDTWRPGHLSAAAAVIAAHPGADAVFLSAAVVDDDGTPVGNHILPSRPFSFEEIALGSILVTMSAAVVRRSALLDVGGFQVDMCEDFDLWLRLSRTHACVSSNIQTVDYVFHGERNRTMNHDWHRRLEDERELIIQRLNGLSDSEDLLSRASAVIRARTARYHLIAGYTSDARRCAVASLRTRPTLEGAVTLAASFAPVTLRERARAARRRWRSRALR